MKDKEGIAFADLINPDEDERKKGFAPNLIKLFDETPDGEIQPYKFADSVEMLRVHIEAILSQIEENTQWSIKKFRIGKSHARRKKDPKSGELLPFDIGDFSTWKLDYGVNQRWSYNYAKEKYDGLVVLTAITRDTLPEPVKETKNLMATPQYYALALQQRLVQYYMFEKCDERLANESLKIGNMVKEPYAGVVYLAYKLTHDNAITRFKKFFKRTKNH